MSHTNLNGQRTVMLKSGAVAAVLASFGLLVLISDKPVLVEPGEPDQFATGVRLNLYEPVDRIPTWLTLPDRSTGPYGHVLAGVGKTRMLFRTFLSTRATEQHYRHLLSANGFQFTVFRLAKSRHGPAVYIDAFDAQTQHSAQIAIHDAQAARAVEITFNSNGLHPTL